MKRPVRAFALLVGLLVSAVAGGAEKPAVNPKAPPAQPRSWDGLPVIALRGGLELFWNVRDGTGGENLRAATQHGFQPITLIGTYSDYPGNQKLNIYRAVGKKPENPWAKPGFFEDIVRRNILTRQSSGTFVHDIELNFQRDPAKAWANPAAREASGVQTFEEFRDAYFREWATWFWLPLKWTKEIWPGARVGLYGVQPFMRDYHGVSGRNARQIEGAHQRDGAIWRYIDPYADFYVASIYVFYNLPDSVFYMAANVEENYQRTRQFGDKPVFAYTWLRYHDSNRLLAKLELHPYLVEAMALVPYFSGGRGIVLWGSEAQIKPGGGQPYERLPLFMQTLARIAPLSDKIGHGRLVIDEPAHVLWKAKRPLVRRVEVAPDECVVLVLNPWQGESATSRETVTCGGKSFELEVQGQHATVAHLTRGSVTLH